MARIALTLPDDWLEAIEPLAGEEGVSHKIRELILRGLPAETRRKLSPNPSRGSGGGRPEKGADA